MIATTVPFDIVAGKIAFQLNVVRTVLGYTPAALSPSILGLEKNEAYFEHGGKTYMTFKALCRMFLERRTRNALARKFSLELAALHNAGLLFHGPHKTGGRTATQAQKLGQLLREMAECLEKK